jgi:hypothetical protein
MLANQLRASLRRRKLKFSLGDHSAFGCGWHRFRRGPRCSRDDLAAFESRWDISLPVEFKTVLTEVGNGCAGPYYGLSPLESWSQPWDISKLDSTMLSRPFDPTAPRERGLHVGAMRICNAGCEHYLLLVVTGRYAGEIWHDGAEDGIRSFPILDSSGRTASFSSWLSDWSDATPDELDDPFWSSFDSGGHAIAKVATSATEQLTTLAVDQLPCPACVSRWGKLDPLPRIIVPTPASSSEGFENPKRAAILAATSQLDVVPRQILPVPRRFLP